MVKDKPGSWYGSLVILTRQQTAEHLFVPMLFTPIDWHTNRLQYEKFHYLVPGKWCGSRVTVVGTR